MAAETVELTGTILDRMPVEDFERRAREARPGRAAKAAVALLFWAIGMTAAKLWRWFWVGASFAVDAMRTGWEEAHGPSKAVIISRLQQENDWMAEQLRRIGGPD